MLWSAWWSVASGSYGLLLQVPTEVINPVQSLLLNYLTVLLRSEDFTIVYYQMGELEYIHVSMAMVSAGCLA